MTESLAKSILQSSEKYVPMNTFALRDSGFIEKETDYSFIVGWDSAYASKQYYTIPEKISPNNPNGTWKWYEKAKTLHFEEWLDEASEDSDLRIE